MGSRKVDISNWKKSIFRRLKLNVLCWGVGFHYTYLFAFFYPLPPLCNLCLDPKSCMAVWLSSIRLPRKLFNDRSLLSNMMLLCHWDLASTAPCKVHRLYTSYFRPSHLAWADLHNWTNLCMKSYLNSDEAEIARVFFLNSYNFQTRNFIKTILKSIFLFY